jgi:Ca2+-transporting ATPase
MLAISLALGLTMLAAVLAAYWWAVQTGRSDGETRAVAFSAIVCANLALIFTTRSPTHTLIETLRQPNPAFWSIVAGALGALLLVIYAGPVARVFRFEPIGAAELGVAALAGTAGVAWYELWKAARKRRSGQEEEEVGRSGLESTAPAKRRRR